MTQHDKLLEKLLNPDTTLTWPELARLLGALGYRQREGSGSRVKFDNGQAHTLISLHRPHPSNDIKAYVRRYVIEQLKAAGLIP